MIEIEKFLFSENIVVPKKHRKKQLLAAAPITSTIKPSNPHSFHNFDLEGCIDEIPRRGGCGGQLQ